MSIKIARIVDNVCKLKRVEGKRIFFYPYILQNTMITFQKELQKSCLQRENSTQTAQAITLITRNTLKAICESVINIEQNMAFIFYC